jgi:putative ferrous iron transport protein C
MLRDIQTYIAHHHTVSIADLALHFHMDDQAIQPMVTKLVRKGRVRREPTPEKCGGCTCCQASSLELYTWAGRSSYPAYPDHGNCSPAPSPQK